METGVQTTVQDRKIQSSAVRTMRAAVIVEPGVIRITDTPVPEPSTGNVVVCLEGCGVCHSNLPPWEGRPWFNYPMEPGMLGHEAWGYIHAVGDSVSGLVVGQRVSMLSNHAYAEYDIAPADAVVVLPAELDGRPFPGEPLGCAMNIFVRSNIKAGDNVAIVGIGFLGSVLTRLASAAGARVIAISRRAYSLEFARAMGAAECIVMDDHWRIIDEVKRLTNGVLCDVTIEAVGQQWPLDLAGELTKERGRLVVAGYHQDGLRQINMQMWNWKGLDVINAHEREQDVYIQGMKSAAQAVANGDIDPDILYTHKVKLENLSDALNMTRDRPDGFLKALVTF